MKKVHFKRAGGKNAKFVFTTLWTENFNIFELKMYKLYLVIQYSPVQLSTMLVDTKLVSSVKDDYVMSSFKCLSGVSYFRYSTKFTVLYRAVQ